MGDLYADDHAIYLPAVNDSYATECAKELDPSRPYPAGLSLKDLVFWEPNGLWHYPYLLHSAGLYSVGALPDNAVTQRERSTSVLVGDSGGFQIGKGSMTGLSALRAGPMNANAAVAAWREEWKAREWIRGWLDTYADYAMTIDMPLWATSPDGASSPFHNCSAQQLIDMTVENLHFIDRFASGRAKWLNVVQGDATAAQIGSWWQAVKWFRRGGWALAGSAGAKGGLVNMLNTLLMMRDDGAFEPGQDWVHVLGVSTPKWAIVLSAVQRALRVDNETLRVSFDSSSPFQTAGRYEDVALSPDFTSDPRSWNMGTAKAPQSRLHVTSSPPMPFAYPQSPIGARLMLHHLSVRGGMWVKRQYDSVSNMLLTNHNVWVYLDAMKRANDLAAARDKLHVPPLYLSCIDLIEEAFTRDDWPEFVKRNARHLDAMAASEYR
jgi:hypothetical protein